MDVGGFVRQWGKLKDLLLSRGKGDIRKMTIRKFPDSPNLLNNLTTIVLFHGVKPSILSQMNFQGFIKIDRIKDPF